MKIEVIRDDGTKRAPDIIDPLCTTDACGIKRAQNFLDENGNDKIEYGLDVAPLTSMSAPGAIVGIQDASLGQSFSARVIGYSITLTAKTNTSPLSITTNIALERGL